MAKDTEKLIRQLSLISYLMAQGRPTSALEIKREVGYSDMNDDAFARRFYADRAGSRALGITLQVEKPGESLQGYESELYSLPPENYYLPEIRFSDDELAAPSTALHLLDGEFAYAEPLRLALQQVSWGAEPTDRPEQSSVEVDTAKADGAEVSQRLSKIETAISRRKTIEFTYYTIERDSEEKRKVDPYHLVYRGGQFYLIGHSHERDGIRVFRLSRIRGKVSYASKAEHDFSPPEEFERRDYARRAEWQLGETQGRARSSSVTGSPGWSSGTSGGTASSATPAAATARSARADLRDRLRLQPPDGRLGAALAPERDGAGPARARRGGRRAARAAQRAPFLRLRARRRRPNGAADPARLGAVHRRSVLDPPERFARLVTLAGMLIESAKGDARLPVADVKERLHVTEEELRDDIDLLNVVNFGGGTYVLYAELQGDEIEVDAEPYGDNFARPPAAPGGEGAGRRDRSVRGPSAQTGLAAPARRSSRPSATTPRRRVSRSRPPAVTTPTSPAR